MERIVADRESLQFHRALTDLIRVYQFRDRNRVCAFGVTVTESHALDRLVHVGPLTLNGLADTLHLDKSTVSRVLDGLEKKGFVRRRPHPDDGRALLLESTARGRKVCKRIERDRVTVEGKLLEDFTPTMLRAATLALNRIVTEADGGSQGPSNDH
jgi:DNA-binding MarR family transcriptional regulator